jgi:hypothetical protein
MREQHEVRLEPVTASCQQNCYPMHLVVLFDGQTFERQAEQMGEGVSLKNCTSLLELFCLGKLNTSTQSWSVNCGRIRDFPPARSGRLKKFHIGVRHAICRFGESSTSLSIRGRKIFGARFPFPVNCVVLKTDRNRTSRTFVVSGRGSAAVSQFLPAFKFDGCL